MGVSTMPVGDSMNVLIIPSVAPSNRANYTYLAKNSAENDSFTAQLLVNGSDFTPQFRLTIIFTII